MSDGLLLAALVLVPVAASAALAAGAGRGSGGRRGPGAIATGAGLLVLALGAWAAVTEPAASLAWGGALRLELAVEGFARVMVVLVPAVAAPVLAYAAAEEQGAGLARLLSLLCLFLAGMQLLVVAADLLLLLIGFEWVGACSWALIAHEWRESGVPRAANHAFVTTRLGDLGLVLAAGAAMAGAGTFSFAELPAIGPPWADVAAAGVLLAAAAKSAQVPFSPWLFSAMRGPTAVSALLHSATMVAAGTYALIRLAPFLGGIRWFGAVAIAVGLLTAVTGGVVASLHHHVKEALAASTSAHYGLMLVAVGAGSAAAAAAHLVTHAFFKSLLFLGAGAAIHASGTGDLRDMRPAGALSRTAAAFAVGALALAAVPPLGGAFSKEEIVKAAAHHAPWLGLAVIAAGFLSAFYAARLQLLAFPSAGRSAAPGRRPSPAALVGMGVLVLVSVGLGALWLPGAGRLVERVVGGAAPPGKAWELLASWATVLAGAGLAWLLARRTRLASLGLPERERARAAAWLGLPSLTERLATRPVRRLATATARFDDRVVDAGVQAAGSAGEGFSRALDLLNERGVDGAVRALARATVRLATGSRAADDAGLDRAVEGGAAAVGAAGRGSRWIQSGSLPRYYVILAAGAAAAFLVLLLGRS